MTEFEFKRECDRQAKLFPELTPDEIKDLVRFDNDLKSDPKNLEIVDDLTKKAKDNKITQTIHAAGDITTRQKRKPAVRKADPDKQMIIAEIASLLRFKEGVNNLEVVKEERLISFNFKGNLYEIMLIKKNLELMKRKGKKI